MSGKVAGRFGMGVIDPSGASISALTRYPGKGGRLETWGDDRAQAALTVLVGRWVRLGRPTLRDLRVTVTYDGNKAPKAWRSITTADSVVALDWSRPPR